MRAGYGYDHSPAPTETISPFIHDADRHTFGAGGSWKYENLRLDFNLRYVLSQTSSTLGISRYGYDGSLQVQQPAGRRVVRVQVLAAFRPSGSARAPRCAV